ncbi:hypothetical protein Halxa_3583 [Halopiger xanaduensis SH-6]|uniref:DUF4397 domain-containing protein n=1 Tax=Halopiger xanaduensis (strain DSM 18323 / JCM 14033 / SH-6) TaxID=797210 RepID=F8DAB1_HALXS|nr:DUF4397 domain-containing protein [Halopiger xanaduensis]AEH38193.1 hypothetical protein Halxa_3583 [Halopiger xanaduensis SH-6]
MTLSRRSTIKTIGVVGAGSALSNSVLAVNQHEDDERDESAQPDEDEETGAIRVAHFSPDAPEVDVYVNDQQILTEVAYDDVSPYLEIVPGTYTLTITAAGDEEAVVYEQQINVGSGYYTAAAIGELEAEDEADGLGSDEGDALASDSDDNSTALEAEDDEYGNESAANETDGGSNATDGETVLEAEEESDASEDPLGEAGTFDVLLLVDRPEEEVDDAIKGEDAGQVRLVHASPDAPNVAVAVDSGQVLFEDVAYTEPSGYVGVSAGDVTLDIYDAADVDGSVIGGMEAEGDDESSLNASDGESGLNASDDEAGDADDDDDSDVIGTEEPEPVASVDVEVDRGQGYTIYAIGYLESADDLGGDASDEEAGVDANETDNDIGNETAGIGNETDDGNETDTDSDLGSSDDTADEDDRSFDTIVLPDGTMDATDADDVDDGDDNDAAEEIDEEPMDDAEDGSANESESALDDDSDVGNESDADDESITDNESAANESDADSDY